MKKFILKGLFMTLLFFSFSGFSKEIDEFTAQKVASNYLSRSIFMLKRGTQSSIALELHTVRTMNNPLKRGASSPLIYIYNFANSNGFILVAADDNVTPILGYSTEQDFDINAMPAQVAAWMKHYEKEIETAIQYNVFSSVNSNKWNEVLNDTYIKTRGVTTAVKPLLTTTWDQGQYYYDKCPYDATSKKYAYTGCVATAMAQVMKYWNYPSTGNGTKTYTNSASATFKFGTLSANFGTTTYDWANMPNKLTAKNDAVATLMSHVGISIEMQYGLDGSGAWITYDSRYTPYSNGHLSLINYWKYDPSSIKSIYKTNYTDQTWTAAIKAEIDKSRPVILEGSASDGSGGHCYVADGYDANNYLHINWGWSGAYNGYFTVSNLVPSGTSTGGGAGVYTFNQGAVLGIRPPTSNLPIADFTTSSSATTIGRTVVLSDKSTNIPQSWNWNISPSTYSFINGTSETSKNPEIVFNNVGEYTVNLTVTNAVGSKSMTKEAFVTVNPALTSQVCDTLTNFLASESKAYIRIKGGGSFAGHVSGNLKSFAESYTNLGSYSHITGAFLDFARAETNNPNSTINVNVYANSGGSPGSILATKSIKITDIRQDLLNVRETKVMFDTPIAVSGQFFIGFEVFYAAGDTVGVYTTGYGAAGTNTSFLQFSDGAWCSYTTCWNKTHLKISPLVAVLPTANFTLSSSTIHPNEVVTFSAANATNAATYNWTFTGANKSNSVSQIVNNSYSTIGTYEVVLNVTNGCGASASKTTTVIVTASCDPGTISGESTVCEGQSIDLTSSVNGGTWSVSDENIGTINEGTLTTTIPGTVVVTYSISNTCKVDKTIIVNAKPEIPSLEGTSIICAGKSATLTPSITGGNWTSSNTDFLTVNNGLIQGILGGTVDVNYTIGVDNCSSTISKTITIDIQPVQPLISGPSKICWNGRAMFRASVAGGVWGVENSTLLLASPQGLFRNSTKPATDNFKSGVNYTIKSKLGACTSKVVKSVWVRNVTAPSISVTALKTGIKVNETTTATATTTIATVGTWSSTNTLVSATANTTNTKTSAVKGLRVGAGANVVYFADDATTGCRQANWLAFNVTSAASMVDANQGSSSTTTGVSVYPNPSNGKFTIENTEGASSVKLVDLSGRVIATKSIITGTTTIDFSEVATGKYMLHINGETINEVQPIVIE